MKTIPLTFVGIVSLFTANGFMACAYNNTRKEYNSIVVDFRSNRSTVQTTRAITWDFLSIKGSIIIVDNEDVQVFEYKNDSAMQVKASIVSSNGGSIGASIVSRMSVPYFIKLAN